MSELLDRLRSLLADRYLIGREVGRGGMAAVFLADDRKHDRQVAVKVLHPELARVVGGERFLREINIAAHLRHPHIVPLLDSGEADGLLYYVMPYVEGESPDGGSRYMDNSTSPRPCGTCEMLSMRLHMPTGREFCTVTSNRRTFCLPTAMRPSWISESEKHFVRLKGTTR